MFKKLKERFRRKKESSEELASLVPGQTPILVFMPDELNPEETHVHIISLQKYPLTNEMLEAVRDFICAYDDWRARCKDGSVWEIALMENRLGEKYVN